MSSPEYNNKHPQPLNRKLEFENYCKAFYLKLLALLNAYKQQLSLVKIACFVSLGLLVLWLASGFYIINEGNRGVLTRFGAYTETMKPGPHWHLPVPIEQVAIVNVEQQRFIEVGYRDTGRGNHATNISQESLMLTTDENIVNIHLAVQYQINDAKNYLFHVKDNEAVLKQLTESVERTVIGASKMDYVLTEGRSEIVDHIKRNIQDVMDNYQAGIIITSVNLQDAQPPEEVQSAFEDAIRAREDKQRLINEAEAYSNDIIPKARGAASRLLLEAEAYEAEQVAKAKGETERFGLLLAEYEKAPAITRKRMYLEAKEKLLSSTNKVIVDAAQHAPQFYMPLQSPVVHREVLKAETEKIPEHSSNEKTNVQKMSSNLLRPSRSKP